MMVYVSFSPLIPALLLKTLMVRTDRVEGLGHAESQAWPAY